MGKTPSSFPPHHSHVPPLQAKRHVTPSCLELTPDVTSTCPIPDVTPTRPDAPASTIRSTSRGLAIRVLQALYGLKQSGRVWFQCFTDEMIVLGFTHNDISPCLFIKQLNDEIVIVAIYVNDLNIFGTPKLTNSTIDLLK